MERMLERTEPHGDGCMVWTGPVGSDGYGRVSVGSPMSAHRVMARASFGSRGLPLSSEPIHHKCGVRTCIRPDHLEPVTRAANMAEMLARTFYERRIRELETALKLVDPLNKALTNP